MFYIIIAINNVSSTKSHSALHYLASISEAMSYFLLGMKGSAEILTSTS